MTLMSYKENFDVFWKKFTAKGELISKEDFIKLFFVDLTNKQVLKKQIKEYLRELEFEATRDTLIYKQYIDDNSIEVLFIGNAIGKFVKELSGTFNSIKEISTSLIWSI